MIFWTKQSLSGNRTDPLIVPPGRSTPGLSVAPPLPGMSMRRCIHHQIYRHPNVMILPNFFWMMSTTLQRMQDIHLGCKEPLEAGPGQGADTPYSSMRLTMECNVFYTRRHSLFCNHCKADRVRGNYTTRQIGTKLNAMKRSIVRKKPIEMMA